MTVTIARASSAAQTLKLLARKADANKDGFLTTAEIHAAKSKVGAKGTAALLDYHSQHRAGVRKDPELRASEKAKQMRFMDVMEIDFAVKMGVEQLKRIDGYKGNARAGVKANKADGTVTDAEIQNYGRTGGKLQLEAKPLVAFAVGGGH